MPRSPWVKREVRSVIGSECLSAGGPSGFHSRTCNLPVTMRELSKQTYKGKKINKVSMGLLFPCLV